MVKATKKGAPKKLKAGEAVTDAGLPVEETSPIPVEDIDDEIVNESIEENGESMEQKTKPKAVAAKNEELDSVKENDPEIQNGAGDAVVKKKAPAKKTAKIEKVPTEPSRKSARTTKPVIIEGSEKQLLQLQDAKDQSTKKRPAAKSSESNKKSKLADNEDEKKSKIGTKKTKATKAK